MIPGILTRSESAVILQPLMTHEHGLASLWSVLKSEIWKAIPGLTLETLWPIFREVLSAFTTEKQEEDVRSFFEGKDTKAFGIKLEQGLEEIAARRRWVERDREDMLAWFKRNGYFVREKTGWRWEMQSLWERVWWGFERCVGGRKRG
jgi:aminopeptidase 2